MKIKDEHDKFLADLAFKRTGVKIGDVVEVSDGSFGVILEFFYKDGNLNFYIKGKFSESFQLENIRRFWKAKDEKKPSPPIDPVQFHDAALNCKTFKSENDKETTTLGAEGKIHVVFVGAGGGADSEVSVGTPSSAHVSNGYGSGGSGGASISEAVSSDSTNGWLYGKRSKCETCNGTGLNSDDILNSSERKYCKICKGSGVKVNEGK